MAGKRTAKKAKAKKPKKIKRRTSKASKKSKGTRPKGRARGSLKSRPKSKAKPKRASKRPAASRKGRAAKRAAASSRGLKSVARGVGGSKPPRLSIHSMSAKSGKSKVQARGAGAPQGLLEFDDGPVATDLPREPVVGALPPIPKKRRGKASQLNMLDYPGESLTVGMQAPEFSLPSTLGRRVGLSEFRGKRVILYFYPKDDTPGCTMEACGFRDSFPRIESKDAIVLGVSLDDELSHERFAQKYNLPFPLLSDKDAAVSRQYGTYKEKNLYGRNFWGIERTTFVIDREGKVEHVFRRVKVEGHAEEVMATLAL
jgi:peroxiredoxin Q/BCP